MNNSPLMLILAATLTATAAVAGEVVDSAPGSAGASAHGPAGAVIKVIEPADEPADTMVEPDVVYEAVDTMVEPLDVVYQTVADSSEPGGGDHANLEAQLEAARKQLETAAHQVAELSAQMGRPLVQDFMAFGLEPGRAIIGVQLEPSGAKDGARVREVSPGGPADEAGVRAGDVIVAVNGADVKGDDPAAFAPAERYGPATTVCASGACVSRSLACSTSRRGVANVLIALPPNSPKLA